MDEVIEPLFRSKKYRSRDELAQMIMKNAQVKQLVSCVLQYNEDDLKDTTLN